MNFFIRKAILVIRTFDYGIFPELLKAYLGQWDLWWHPNNKESYESQYVSASNFLKIQAKFGSPQMDWTRSLDKINEACNFLRMTLFS